jgi:hypothetical protein
VELPSDLEGWTEVDMSAGLGKKASLRRAAGHTHTLVIHTDNWPIKETYAGVVVFKQEEWRGEAKMVAQVTDEQFRWLLAENDWEWGGGGAGGDITDVTTGAEVGFMAANDHAGPCDLYEEERGEQAALKTASEEPTVEEVEQVVCSVCGGPGVYMGGLGKKKWFRCQDCGIEFARKDACLSARQLRTAVLDATKPDYPAESESTLFNADTAEALAVRLMAEIKAPFVKAYVSTFGGAQNSAVMMTVGADPKESWVNGILENSLYGKFHISMDGAVERHSGPLWFRRRRVKSVDELIAKVNAAVEAAEAGRTARGSVLYDNEPQGDMPKRSKEPGGGMQTDSGGDSLGTQRPMPGGKRRRKADAEASTGAEPQGVITMRWHDGRWYPDRLEDRKLIRQMVSIGHTFDDNGLEEVREIAAEWGYRLMLINMKGMRPVPMWEGHQELVYEEFELGPEELERLRGV